MSSPWFIRWRGEHTPEQRAEHARWRFIRWRGEHSRAPVGIQPWALPVYLAAGAWNTGRGLARMVGRIVYLAGGEHTNVYHCFYKLFLSAPHTHQHTMQQFKLLKNS